MVAILRRILGLGRVNDVPKWAVKKLWQLAPSALRSYIKTLRQKLEPDPAQPRYLITEAGVGYRLLADSNK